MLSTASPLHTTGLAFDPPSVESLLSRIQNYREQKDLLNARILHLQMCNYGLECNPTLGNYVVPMFVDCGSLLDAQKVFKQLDYHTEHSWTSIIEGFHKNGEWELGFHLYHEMVHQHVNPSEFTFSVLLKGCARLKYLERGQELHSELIKKGFEISMTVGNSLVEMYANCGLIMDSESTFDNLQNKNSLSWTALASGYLELGFAQEALACLESMQGEGFSHNVFSFLCSVKACGILRQIEMGYLVHAEVIINGFESLLFIASALVDMYVKLELLSHAQDVFDEMSSRDSVVWNLLFTGYADHGYDEITIKCWEQMNFEGVPPDAVSYVTIIKACANIGAVERGLEMHSACLQKGFESDPFVCSMLIDMYMKFAYFQEAQKVFDLLATKDVVLWTGLIAGYAEHGLGEQAWGCFKGMCHHRVLPNSITFACTFKACCAGKLKSEGQELHIEALKMGLESDVLVSGSMIGFYVHKGLLAEAEELFNRLPVQDLVAWNILIAGYVEHGEYEEGLKCYNRMQEQGLPGTAPTFVGALKACGGMGDVKTGQEVHASIVNQGLEKDPPVGNSLVDMYARCGFLAEAEDGFKSLGFRDVISWTALINGYADNNMGFNALRQLELMQEDGICPDVVTYMCALQACICINSREKGQLMHTEVVIKGLEEDPLVVNALVDMYAKLGSCAEAQTVFSKVPDPDVGMWNTLIQGYVELGLIKDATSFLEQMQLEGCLSPDEFTWNTIMAGYIDHDDVERVLTVYAQMQEQGVTPNDFTFINLMAACGNTSALQLGRRFHAQIVNRKLLIPSESLAVSLIDMYGKFGSMIEAWQVFETMPERDIVSWNSLLAGYIRQGQSKTGFFLHNLMIEEGFVPNEITFLCLLSACQHAGLVEIGKDCFEFMSMESGIEPNMKHYACTFDLLGRAGRLNEIVALIQEMPFQPNLVIWRTFIGACQRFGNLNLGQQVFKLARSLGEKQAVPPSFVSNIYVEIDSEMSPSALIFEESGLV